MREKTMLQVASASLEQRQNDLASSIPYTTANVKRHPNQFTIFALALRALNRGKVQTYWRLRRAAQLMSQKAVARHERA